LLASSAGAVRARADDLPRPESDEAEAAIAAGDHPGAARLRVRQRAHGHVDLRPACCSSCSRSRALVAGVAVA